ncbi:hypothetical protein SELMODRAFT_424597 [Selaginella moellendorffii]|uniref:Uncharacterized protein n=1 Tax=Selaginella moellendorffii TaxID=88036 RepID=D8SQF3_SELML|nr:hypothetical protein SELMODRAFT_424597 [Selaginella moellendorffii]
MMNLCGDLPDRGALIHTRCSSDHIPQQYSEAVREGDIRWVVQRDEEDPGAVHVDVVLPFEWKFGGLVYLHSSMIYESRATVLMFEGDKLRVVNREDFPQEIVLDSKVDYHLIDQRVQCQKSQADNVHSLSACVGKAQVRCSCVFLEETRDRLREAKEIMQRVNAAEMAFEWFGGIPCEYYYTFCSTKVAGLYAEMSFKRPSTFRNMLLCEVSSSNASGKLCNLSSWLCQGLTTFAATPVSRGTILGRRRKWLTNGCQSWYHVKCPGLRKTGRWYHCNACTGQPKAQTVSILVRYYDGDLEDTLLATGEDAINYVWRPSKKNDEVFDTGTGLTHCKVAVPVNCSPYVGLDLPTEMPAVFLDLDTSMETL